MNVRSKDKKLIGLAGKAGVGKTTTAEWFVQQHSFVKLAFADPLKESCVALTGLSMMYFTDADLKEMTIPGLKVTPRILMQKLGTEFVRNMIAPYFWIWRMNQSISKHSDKDIIIDDVRFPNEVDFIKKNGGIIVHLERDFISPTDQTEHKSEMALKVKSGDIWLMSEESAELTALKISTGIL